MTLKQKIAQRRKISSSAGVADMDKVISSAVLGFVASVTLWPPAAAQVQCPHPIPDHPSGDQIVACLKEQQEGKPIIVNCSASGLSTPSNGEWRFIFENGNCSRPISDFDVVGGSLLHSYICGGTDNHSIELSPPSITFYGVKPQCANHVSTVTVQYTVRAKK
jgi:hypothetical protein